MRDRMRDRDGDGSADGSREEGADGARAPLRSLGERLVDQLGLEDEETADALRRQIAEAFAPVAEALRNGDREAAQEAARAAYAELRLRSADLLSEQDLETFNELLDQLESRLGGGR